MVDSIAILPPGWQAQNSSGALITDGILEFFDAGTSNAREVFSDFDLSESLGTTVDCNSAGYPVTSGNAKTLIYTGSTPYKVRLTSVIVGGTVWEFDDVRGALDTSSFLTSAAVADQSVVAVSTNRAVTSADKGKLLNVNCSAGALTMTLDDAATLGDGFFVGIRHDGTANQVKITGDGSDTFGISGVNVTGFSLTGRGQSIWITCDAANFKTHSEAPPLIAGTNGVIVIADRLSAPPVSPTPGARYIVTTTPTGAWSTFTEHDIAEADGFGTWFKYTPATDIGWIAYVQDEDTYYSFVGSAWVPGLNRPPTVQRFTSGSAQTYTPSAGTRFIRVRMVGGGGGGGAVATNAGAVGVDTSFGSWTAIHGNGGGINGGTPGAGGTGGATGTGTLINRIDGANGNAAASAGTTSLAGGGGSSVFGGAGSFKAATGAGDPAKTNTGSGGGGGVVSGGSGAANGGGAGEYVEFFVTSPAPTTYTVGTGGAGGAAGTQAGGNGAAGIIIIEEF